MAEVKRRQRTSTAIRFDPDIHDALVAYADQLGVSINWLCNKAVSKFLDELPPVEEVALIITNSNRETTRGL